MVRIEIAKRTERIYVGIKLYREPPLEHPDLIASWPGIGNIGLIAADILRGQLEAEELGEIEPWDFFYPKKVRIRDGELKDMEFPASTFYFKRTALRDIIVFLGEEQPSDDRGMYAEGKKAYKMANLVLDVAEHFGCRRIYTSGAAVAPVHHTMTPRVWAVPNTEKLISEIKTYRNTVLMSEIEGRDGQGMITGLNGLLLGVARKRGIDAICLMGEIPIYLEGSPFAYPKASRSIINVLSAALNIDIDCDQTNRFVERSEREINDLYEKLPTEIKDQLDRLKHIGHDESKQSEPITEDDKQRILEDIDKLFKKGTKED